MLLRLGDENQPPEVEAGECIRPNELDLFRKYLKQAKRASQLKAAVFPHPLIGANGVHALQPNQVRRSSSVAASQHPKRAIARVTSLT